MLLVCICVQDLLLGVGKLVGVLSPEENSISHSQPYLVGYSSLCKVEIS